MARPSDPQQGCLSVSEVERIANGMSDFGLEEVGTPAWLDQHDWVEKLNLQAHVNAQSHSDEFVKEVLVSLDRVTTLVKDLLVTEVWRQRLFPLLKQHLAEQVDSVTTYLVLYHEAALANLLEVLLYHPDACESISEDALLELCDWCYRKLLYLTTESHQHVAFREASVQQMLARSAVEELEEKERELQFSTALCALTILRYMTEHMNKLSLGLMARLVTTNDTAMALLPLLERPPWVRRGKSGTEKFIGGKWQAVEGQERLRLTQQDGQVWLALYNLVVDPGCRSKMELTESRCDALFKLKRHFSELLLDQLPVLRDLQRVIDELAFGVGTNSSQAAPANNLVIEQVSLIRASLLRRDDWGVLAERAMREQFGPSSRQLSQQRVESMLKAFDLMSSLEEDAISKQAVGAMPTSIKLEAYREVKTGVWEWWSTYYLDINTDKPPEPVSTTVTVSAMQQATSNSGAAAAAADENHPRQPQGGGSGKQGAGEQKQEAMVRGLRYRLLPLSENLQRALPARGKLAVVFGGHTCQASLELPTSETRDTSPLAPAVWLTVGSLAGNGMALQLKLKRLDKPSERDKVLGEWWPYVPVAGALTVREGLLA